MSAQESGIDLLGPRLDRQLDRRGDDEQVRAWWADPSARLLAVDGADRIDVEAGTGLPGGPVRGDRDPERDHLLGTVGGVPWFVRRVEQPADLDVRRVETAPPLLDVVWAGLATLHWHEDNPRCPRCGAATTVAGGGPARRCQGCGRHAFPRTDPAIITAVLDDDDRIVLARRGVWPPGRVSVLAGYVESGEAAEHTVVREVAEETTVEVSATRYLASQPWPYPRSLMLGFVSRGSGAVQVDHDELVEGAWYTREEVRARVAAGRMVLPGPTSIARRLVDLWLDDDLPRPESGTRLLRPR